MRPTRRENNNNNNNNSGLLRSVHCIRKLKTTDKKTQNINIHKFSNTQIQHVTFGVFLSKVENVVKRNGFVWRE